MTEDPNDQECCNSSNAESSEKIYNPEILDGKIRYRVVSADPNVCDIYEHVGRHLCRSVKKVSLWKRVLCFVPMVIWCGLVFLISVVAFVGYKIYKVGR